MVHVIFITSHHPPRPTVTHRHPPTPTDTLRRHPQKSLFLNYESRPKLEYSVEITEYSVKFIDFKNSVKFIKLLKV